MGPLTIAPSSVIYLDANTIIYSVERIKPYHSLLLHIWQQAASGTLSLVTSELSLLETLVGPLKAGDSTLDADYRRLLQQASDLKSVAISGRILERAARLRATANLKTPDAIHGATALEESCSHLVTNDPAFRRVPGLYVVVLSDLLAP